MQCLIARGNGLKVLTANNFIPQHTPVIECRRKYMLGGGTGGPKSGRSFPFVLVHRLSQEIEVVVDGMGRPMGMTAGSVGGLMLGLGRAMLL